MVDWGRIAIHVDQAHEALGHRILEVAGAVLVTNPVLPDIHVANYGRSITAATPGEIDALLARAEREFARCPHRCFEVDPDTPAAFEGRLVVADAGDTPQTMYAAMGFRQVATKRRYVRYPGSG